VIFRRALGQLDVKPDLSGFELKLGAVVPVCGLYVAGSPVGTRTALDILVTQGVLPDFDLGTDGIGSFDVADGRVVACHDGAGDLIPGADCACDSRMDDGYSVGFHFAGVPGTLVGVEGGT
jgi:hypothetical protein